MGDSSALNGIGNPWVLLVSLLRNVPPKLVKLYSFVKSIVI
jgi:hypothetical protein